MARAQAAAARAAPRTRARAARRRAPMSRRKRSPRPRRRGSPDPRERAERLADPRGPRTLRVSTRAPPQAEVRRQTRLERSTIRRGSHGIASAPSRPPRSGRRSPSRFEARPLSLTRSQCPELPPSFRRSLTARCCRSQGDRDPVPVGVEGRRPRATPSCREERAVARPLLEKSPLPSLT